MESVLSEHFDDILAHYNQYAKRPTEHSKKRLIAYISKQYRTTKKVAGRVVSGTKGVFRQLNGVFQKSKGVFRKSKGVYVPSPVPARLVGGHRAKRTTRGKRNQIIGGKRNQTGGGIVAEDNKIVNALDIIATVAALVPGVNFAAAPAAAVTSILLGDVIGVILSLLELIPAIGIIPGAMKLIYRLRKIYTMSRKTRTGVQVIRQPVQKARFFGNTTQRPGLFSRVQGQVQKVQGQVQQAQNRIAQVQNQIRPQPAQTQRPQVQQQPQTQRPQPGDFFDWQNKRFVPNTQNYDVSEKTLCKQGDTYSQLQYYILNNKNLLQLVKETDTGNTFAQTLLSHWNRLGKEDRVLFKHCNLWDTSAPTAV